MRDIFYPVFYLGSICLLLGAFLRGYAEIAGLVAFVLFVGLFAVNLRAVLRKRSHHS